MKMELKDSTKTKILIAEKGLSLRDFSKVCGVSQGYLSQILNESKQPSAKVAYKISKGLGAEVRNIFFILFD